VCLNICVGLDIYRGLRESASQMRCSELQCVAVCGGMLQRVADVFVDSHTSGGAGKRAKNTLHCVAECCIVLQCVAVSCSVL